MIRSEKEIRERIEYLNRWLKARQTSGAMQGVLEESIDTAKKELLWVLGEWEFKQSEPKIIGVG